MKLNQAHHCINCLEIFEATGGELPSLKRIIVGGAPMAPALMARIERRLGVTVQTSWGMTELSPLGTIAPPDDPLRTASVSGRPAVGVDLLLTDAAGAALPEQRGVEGHLRVRGAAVVERYFGQAESATDDDGWFATGDLARIDARGNLSITGRAKDLIIVNGRNIWPQDIEVAVEALPRLRRGDACAFSVEVTGAEQVVVLVQSFAGSPEELQALVGDIRQTVREVAGVDCRIELISRQIGLPLTSSGKLSRSRAKATLLAGGYASLVDNPTSNNELLS